MSWWNAPLTQGFGPTDEPRDSGYAGYPHFNKGHDYAVPLGTPIEAIVGGVVVHAGRADDGWGTSVKVRDAQGRIHNYGHLSAADVRVGQQVAPGALLGKSGNTGRSSGPHLSYDVWRDGPQGRQYLNPAAIVGGAGGGGRVTNQEAGMDEWTNPTTGTRYTRQPDGNWRSSAGVLIDAEDIEAMGGPAAGSGGGGAGTTPRTQLRDLPDGRTVLIDLNTGGIIKDYGRAPRTPNEPDQVLGNGVFQDSRGYYVLDRTGSSPTEVQKRYITAAQAESIVDPQSAPAAQSADTINAGGRVLQWNPQTQRYDIDIGSSSTPQPQYPSTQITDRGDVFTVDPYTGVPTFQYNDPRLAATPERRFEVSPRTGDLVSIDALGNMTTVAPGWDFQQFSPQQEREQELADLARSEQFETSERLGSEAWRTAERLGGEQFEGNQNAILRALEASTEASRFGLDRSRLDFDVQRTNREGERQYNQDRLGAAEQFANLVSLTDPAALPAFYEAGGGVIHNALARGADALSDNALLPAARSLSTAESLRWDPINLTLPEYNPFAYDPSMFGFQAAPPPAPPVVKPPVVKPPVVPPPAGDGFGSGINRYVPRTFEEDQAQRQAAGQPALGTAQQYAPVVAAMNAGRQAAPQPGPMAKSGALGTANDYAAVVEAMNRGRMVKAADGFNGVVTDPTLILAGEQGPEQVSIQPGEQPFVDRVRRIRTGVQVPDINPFDPRTALAPPSLVQRFLSSRQSKYGIPEIDQLAEMQRYALPGVSRGAFNFSI